MEHKAGCLICGAELVYLQSTCEIECQFCQKPFNADVACENGHYICDRCHSLSANEIIQEYCTNSRLVDPVEMAIELMKHPSIKMHGPEHHFMVPAVLLAAYFNQKPESDVGQKSSLIVKARERAEKVLGGFCGSHGTCGAAMGTGIFSSLILGNTPLKKEEWRRSNHMTGTVLLRLAEEGGPRCCKRDSYIALIEAAKAFNIDCGATRIHCEFSEHNRQCLKEECQFYSPD